MNDIKIIEDFVDQLRNERLVIQQKLDKLPGGRLCIQHNGNYTQWIAVLPSQAAAIGQSSGWRLKRQATTSRGNFSEYYLPKNNNKFAQQLILREYYEQRIYRIDQLTECFNNYLQRRMPDIPAEKLCLVEDVLSPIKGSLKDWATATYPTNPSHPENLSYRCDNGLLVRARIEVIIANLLIFHGIPFRYEDRFTDNEGSFYPDFHIFHPNTHKEYVWEHLGLLDKSYYVNNSVSKFKRLINMGFLPGDTLLFTSESENHQVNLNAVNSLIHYIINDV